MKLSIVIPAYNEEERLEKTFTALIQGFSSDALRISEVIFVNDGSLDGTKQMIAQWIDSNKDSIVAYRLISYRTNRGKGYAVKKGMLAAREEYVLFMDTDMSTPLTEIVKMIPAMQQGLDVIVGTRKNGHSTVIRHQPLYRELLGKAFTLLSNIVTNTWMTDFTCGFKVFSKQASQKIFKQAQIDHWGYDAEILFIANRLNMTIQEVPVVWSNDERSKVNLLEALPQTLGELYAIRKNDLMGRYGFKRKSVFKTFIPALRWLSTYI